MHSFVLFIDMNIATYTINTDAAIPSSWDGNYQAHRRSVA
jgi:hypothetical protein